MMDIDKQLQTHLDALIGMEKPEEFGPAFVQRMCRIGYNNAVHVLERGVSSGVLIQASLPYLCTSTTSLKQEKEINMELAKYVTVVIRMPEDAASIEKVHEGLQLLKPHKTAMSLEDEMTVLELIEQHEDFEPHIADEARAKAAELHAAAEAVPA